MSSRWILPQECFQYPGYQQHGDLDLQDHQAPGTGTSRDVWGWSHSDFEQIILHRVSKIIWMNVIQTSHTTKKCILGILYYWFKVFYINSSAYKWFIITFYDTDSPVLALRCSCWLLPFLHSRVSCAMTIEFLWHEEIFILPVRSAYGSYCSSWFHKMCCFIANMVFNNLGSQTI